MAPKTLPRKDHDRWYVINEQGRKEYFTSRDEAVDRAKAIFYARKSA